MVFYACVYFPGDRTFSTIQKNKFKTDIEIGSCVDFVWKNENKSESWKAIIVKIGENTKELDQLSQQLSEKVEKCHEKGGDPKEEIIKPLVGDFKEIANSEPGSCKRKRKLTTIMQESIDQQEDESKLKAKSSDRKKENQKVIKKNENENKCDVSNKVKKNAEIAASIISNNSMVKAFSEKLNNSVKVPVKATSSIQNENKDNVEDVILTTCNKDESLTEAAYQKQWNQLLENNHENEKNKKKRLEPVNEKRFSFPEIYRQAFDTVNFEDNETLNDHHDMTELENMQCVINRLQEDKNVLERETIMLKKENDHLKKLAAQVDFQRLCPAPSSSVMTFFKSCVEWSEKQNSNFNQIKIFEARHVEHQRTSLTTIAPPRSPTPPPSTMGPLFTPSTPTLMAPPRSPTPPPSTMGPLLTPPAPTFAPPRSPTPPPPTIEQPFTPPTPAIHVKQPMTSTPSTLRRSPRKHITFTEMSTDMTDVQRTEESIKANLYPKEGANKAQLIDGIPVYVERNPLRKILSKCQNLKDDATTHLLRKLILIVFDTTELAESRGQGINVTDKESKTLKKPLDAVKCKACKEYVRAYGMMSKKKLLDETTENSIFTQQVTYARNKIKRKNVSIS